MRHDTVGRRLLQRVLLVHTRTEVAAVCRVSRVAVTQWALGTTSPRDEKRMILMTRYKIPAGAWCEQAHAVAS